MQKKLENVRYIIGLVGVLLLATSVFGVPQYSHFSGTDSSEELIKIQEPQDIFISSYIPHDPIVIESNSNFSSQ